MYGRMAAAAGALALIGLLTAGTGAGPAPDTAVILQGGDVVTLDPYDSSSLPDQNPIVHIFETLTRYGDDLKLLPGLAESWRLRDARTWEFKLVAGRRFQNGEPLNAQAMRFSLLRGKEFYEKRLADVQYAYNLLDLDTVEALDDVTLRVRTKQPSPILPLHMAHSQTAAMPPRYVSQTPQNELQRKVIGSGPYRLVEFVPNERVVLEAWNEHPSRHCWML